jgi:hypothetical protein
MVGTDFFPLRPNGTPVSVSAAANFATKPLVQVDSFMTTSFNL